ncbi:hypothetical protein H0H93_003069 [Arthromyces matolae]|nr:hypothetical protein H0H93_003069 [Arthromyces matolae]
MKPFAIIGSTIITSGFILSSMTVGATPIPLDLSNDVGTVRPVPRDSTSVSSGTSFHLYSRMNDGTGQHHGATPSMDSDQSQTDHSSADGEEQATPQEIILGPDQKANLSIPNDLYVGFKENYMDREPIISNVPDHLREAAMILCRLNGFLDVLYQWWGLLRKEESDNYRKALEFADTTLEAVKNTDAVIQNGRHAVGGFHTSNLSLRIKSRQRALNIYKPKSEDGIS